MRMRFVAVILTVQGHWICNITQLREKLGGKKNA